MDVRAELMANVWKIEVAPGMAVTAGQTLMVVESMKMEIPVVAPVAGTVAHIHVGEGDAVAQGQVLARIE